MRVRGAQKNSGFASQAFCASEARPSPRMSRSRTQPPHNLRCRYGRRDCGRWRVADAPVQTSNAPDRGRKYYARSGCRRRCGPNRPATACRAGRASENIDRHAAENPSCGRRSARWRDRAAVRRPPSSGAPDRPGPVLSPPRWCARFRRPGRFIGADPAEGIGKVDSSDLLPRGLLVCGIHRISPRKSASR